MKISREKFIRLGTALGVGAAGASLAACGGSASSGGGSGGKKSGGDSGGGDYGGANSGGNSDGGSKKAASPDKAAIAAESDVAPGSAVPFKDAGSPAVLVHLDNGDFVAYSAVCTHQGCKVEYKNGELACPCHGSVFDPADGAAVIAGPAPRPLTEIPVKVQGGDVVKA